MATESVASEPERDVAAFATEDGTIDLAAVEDTVEHGLVALGRFTDEELHLLADRHEVIDDELEAPRLRALAADAQSAALDAALCLLLARGDLDVGSGDPGAAAEADGAVAADDAGQLFPVGRHALVARCREEPLGVLRLRRESRDHEEPELFALYHVTDRLVLLEVVEVAGIHTLVFVSPERAVAWLVAELDPDGSVSEVSDDPVVAAELDDVADELDRALSQASHVSVVDVARAGDGQVDHLAVTVYAGDEGVTCFRGWAHGDQGEVRLHRVGRDDLVAMAHELVTVALRPAPASP